MYTIRYSQEVRNYLADNRFDYHVAGVHVELKLLADTLDGLPGDRDSCYHLSETERVYWLVEHHLVVYKRETNDLYISMIQPLE